MTRQAVADALAGTAAPAPPHPAGSRHASLTQVFADPRVRLGAAAAVILATALTVRGNRVTPREARVFRAVNGLPDSLYPLAWLTMQMGALGAAPVAAGAAWLTKDRKLAGQLLASGSGSWALAKLVKRIVRRPRPAFLLAGIHSRGAAATGLGYLSGHAGVAAALGAAALPHLGPAGRAAALTAIPAVGLTRVYVGAHLPLDIVGGVALGIAVDTAVTLRGAGRPGAGTNVIVVNRWARWRPGRARGPALRA
jgi:glycosyltransferase 2 family protein